ncbi:unnamed protein product [Fusarium graminearum]|uniref:Velvet domain-containing protein n=1 Tax=Gibberella zeae TaxID=5518 RepID=A0A9N8WZP5_GIBZA|nr:unnamed protein product [Fusarium graminearum]
MASQACNGPSSAWGGSSELGTEGKPLWALYMASIALVLLGGAFAGLTIAHIFDVYNAKDFPGMQASTELVKRLRDQGCIIPIKKGVKSNNARRHDHFNDEESGMAVPSC